MRKARGIAAMVASAAAWATSGTMDVYTSAVKLCRSSCRAVVEEVLRL
jgi:precorrin-4 methylase